MLFYGWVAPEEETDPVYGMLRNALMQMPEDYPFRDPGKYNEGEFTYTNAWEGEVDRFAGEEQIIQKDKLIYKARYMGGLVNQREGV